MVWPISLAYIIDLVVGDPRWIPHPVVLIGKLISWLEKGLRRWIAPAIGFKAAGVLLLLITVGFTFGVMYYLLEALFAFNYWLAVLVNVWLLSTTLATKSLYLAGKEIYYLLRENNISEARKKVGWIVGRDTENLDEGEIVRATVETVAENIVDGITSPLFYAVIGGLPLAMAYKAVNTLDSMVGYKNEKYLELGWASARFDDLANFVPARITALLIVFAAWLTRKNWRQSWRMIMRDAKKHPSPNSGYSEAGIAGALNIRLGGLNYYGGRESFRAYMGDPIEPLTKNKIIEANQQMVVTSIIMLLFGLILTSLLR